MKKINIPFPKIEGMEVDKVTAYLEKGYSVVEYGAKHDFKVGSLVVAQEFKKGDAICTVNELYSHLSAQLSVLCYISDGKPTNGRMYMNAELSECRDLSDKEQQIFTDILTKDGKRFNAITKEIEDLLLVPESINIFQYKEMVCSAYNKGDGLHIAFNNNKQLLSISDGLYHVQPYDSGIFRQVECYLQRIKREDIKSGDTIFASNKIVTGDSSKELSLYKQMLDDGFHSCIRNVNVEFSQKEFEVYYKLIPISKSL